MKIASWGSWKGRRQVYLKKLEIHGFKSFADKTVLEFKPGITLVVGPNGSGKSNIADAVRWVLGEQSVKSLRGGKMEDVIFAGSEMRRSLGMAEVSLTIDNSAGLFPLEFNEVTVTRRLYRSGESDYLINRVPCRLRDIHELFMDTGVGREGISIIGQGKVDEILSVKPEDRRGLIEEAAGIVKYRHRKKEAAKKLEDTELSLIRLNDIVGELTLQKEPMAEQSRKAQIFKGLKTELDALEIGLLVDELESASRRLESIEKSRKNQVREIEQFRTNQLEAESKEEEQKFLLQKKEESISSQQEKIYEENLRLEKNDSEMTYISERLNEMAKQRKNLNQDIQQLKEELESLGKDYALHNTSGETLQKSLMEAKENLQKYETFLAQDQAQDQEMARRLEDMKEKHFEALQDETGLNNELTSLKQRFVLVTRQHEQLQEKQQQTIRDSDMVKAKIMGLAKEADGISARQASLEGELLSLEDEYRIAEKNSRELQQKVRNLREERNSVLARKRVLGEMEREGQGYHQGVRELLQQKDGPFFAGIIGTVAQVVHAPREYELAVEVALGGSLQYVISENEEAAEKAINWLKKNEKGRVTFLPLTTIRGRKREEAPAGPGIIGSLSDLVSCEEKFKNIIEYLLGGVWLVDNLSTAINTARKTGYRYRIVTLDGQIINAGGSITGGSLKPNSGGILSRKRNLKELEQVLAELQSTILNAEQELEENTGIMVRLQDKIAEIKERLQELHIQKAENNTMLQRWKSEEERYCSEQETLRWQLEETSAEKENLTKAIKETEQQAEALTQTIGRVQQELQSLQELFKKKQAERIKKNEQLTQLRIDVATIEEKVNAHQKENHYLSQRLKQLTEYKLEKEKGVLELKNKRTELEEKLSQMEKGREKQLKNILKLEKQLEQLKTERFSLQEELQRAYQQAKEFGSLLKEKEEKLHQLDVQQSRYEASQEAVTSRLLEQYGIDLEEAKERSLSLQDKKTTQQRINDLKEEITSLGEVNLAAIEEYKRLTDRLEFLSGQIFDMTEAKERLLQVIGEMDQIMTKRFKETYSQVDKAFQEMFVRLFGGGRAQLVMTEEDNILEAGIEIIAQPPGKKTQHLSLLSGGEKALTAIALLMAVLKVKPSPFCVLDEIESNLDESNVNSFAALLKEFAANTQFIVISHRKGTMEIAHVLYGVTIEETGVSRLISVKMEDAKKEAS